MSECKSERCTKKSTHRVIWQDADGVIEVCIELCLEHFNAFVLAPPMRVTTDLVSEWRLPEKAQVVLDDMVEKIAKMVEGGDRKGAAEAVGIARAHIQHATERGLELETDKLRVVEDALMGYSDEANT